MSWITSIAQGIEKAFSGIRPALKMIPPLLLICELYRRPGLSAIALTSAIIRRLPEAGIETGVNADGSPNKINGFVRIISEEIVKEFKTKFLPDLMDEIGDADLYQKMYDNLLTSRRSIHGEQCNIDQTDSQCQ